MAVTVEIEGQTFEGATLADASKLARKAERAARKAEAQRKVDHESARIRAGYNVAHFMQLQEANPGALWVLHPGDKFWPSHVRADGDRRWALQVQTGQHRAEWALFGGYRPIAIVVDMGDNTMAVALRDDDTGKTEWYGAAAQGDSVAAFDFPALANMPDLAD